MKTKDKFRNAMERMFRDTFVNNPKIFDAMWDIFEFVDDEPAKKDPVMNDKESFADDYGRLPYNFPGEYWNYYKQGFKKGVENGELRYRETTTADDFWFLIARNVKEKDMIKINQIILDCWQACKKSHGLD